MSFLRRLLGGGRDATPPAHGPHAGLMRDCRRTADEILAYLDARAKKLPSPEPPVRNNDAWHEAQNNHARYQMDTMTEHRARFETRLGKLRDELKQQAISDAAFDELVDHPGNPDRARAAARQLGLLAGRLDPEVAALEKIYASDRVIDAE